MCRHTHPLFVGRLQTQQPCGLCGPETVAAAAGKCRLLEKCDAETGAAALLSERADDLTRRLPTKARPTPALKIGLARHIRNSLQVTLLILKAVPNLVPDFGP